VIGATSSYASAHRLGPSVGTSASSVSFDSSIPSFCVRSELAQLRDSRGYLVRTMWYSIRKTLP
jgi:hypothetical protein